MPVVEDMGLVILDDGTRYQFIKGKKYLMNIQYQGKRGIVKTCEPVRYDGWVSGKLLFISESCPAGPIFIQSVIKELD